jgi:MFS family permease
MTSVASEVIPTTDRASSRPLLGLKENWQQFSLLVLINAFVGTMVGLERTVLPLIAEHDFGIASRSAMLSFIGTFGIVKAVTNLVAGRLGESWTRKNVLLTGWLFALPVPFMVMLAPSWKWVVGANVLLGINQGLAWSTTVIMKIDLVGPRQRGLATGLNEFAGYIAVAVAAFASGEIAVRYGLRPEPFYLGIAAATLGLFLTLLFVRDTAGHVREEIRAIADGPDRHGSIESGLSSLAVFSRATWSDPALATASHAGLVNNLNDGVAWGLFPLFFAAAGMSLHEISILAFIYPAMWGVSQLATGHLSDRWGRKGLIVSGMLLQGAALVTIAFAHGMSVWMVAAACLGLGTAMVYPTLISVIGDVAHPSWRGNAVGVYRFWRDSGYAIGAIAAGLIADRWGMTIAIASVGLLTAATGILTAVRMPETHTFQRARI